MTSLSGIEKNMNLNINIPTKKRIANLDIFLYFIINSRKSQKWFLTTVLNKLLKIFMSLNGHRFFP